MRPVIGKVVSSPPLSRPPFRINPGFPPTPGKSSVAPGCLARSSELVSIINESPGKVWNPDAAGLRMRVLLAPLPIVTPLETVSYVLPATGGPTAVPVPLVFQIAAVQLLPPGWTTVVVRLAAPEMPELQRTARAVRNNNFMET